MPMIERPYKYAFTKNEIRYVFQLDSLDRAGLFLQVRIMYAAIGAAAFTELTSFELKPDSDGKIYIYLQQYLDSLLNYVLPDTASEVTNADAQCCRFYIEFREVTDLAPDDLYSTSELDNGHIRYAIKGGIEAHKNSRNNFFINHLFANKNFLTWQPAQRFVFADEPVYLSFLNVVNTDAQTGSKIKLTRHFDDDTETDTILATTANNLLVHAAPLLNNALSLWLTPKLVWFEVSVVSPDEFVTIINPYRLYVEYRPVYTSYTLVYLNSISGVSGIFLTGEIEKSLIRTIEETEGGFSLSDWTDKTKTHQSFISPALKRKYSGNIGNLKTRTEEQKDALAEFFASKNIYMLIDDRWVPVENVETTISLGKPADLVEGLDIQWQLSEENEVFTPAGKTFGQGTHIETYP